jgi:hypothetical protein
MTKHGQTRKKDGTLSAVRRYKPVETEDELKDRIGVLEAELASENPEEASWDSAVKLDSCDLEQG